MQANSFKIIIILLFLSENLYAQELSKYFEKLDSIPKNCIILNDSSQFWQINKNLRVLKTNKTSSVWTKDNAIDIWKVSTNTFAINLLNYNIDLWLQEDSLQIWTKNNSSKISTPVNAFSHSDSTKFWTINDSLQLFGFRDTFTVWKVNPNTNYHKISFLDDVLYLTDSTRLWLISDSLYLWTLKDSSVLWLKKSEPESWVISSATKVWPINETVELWETNKTKKFWQENLKDGSWTPIDTLKTWFLGDSSQLYQLNNFTFVKNKGDKISIWNRSTKPVYSIFADKKGKIWTVPPPAPIIEFTDSLDTVKEKTIESLFVDNNTHFWDMNDSLKVWQIKEGIEVWKQIKDFKTWQINDSTKILTLGEKIRLSFMNQKIMIWLKNDSTKIWEKEKTAKAWKFSTQELGRAWIINDSLKYTENGYLWSTYPNYNIANIEESWRGIEVWKHPQKIEVWTIQNEIRLWTNDEKVSVWRPDNSIQYMKVNDSTKVWQVNSEIRLSQVDDILIIWEKQETSNSKKWVISNKYPPIRFQYQGKPMVIPIFENLQIWQQNKNVSFWRRDTKTQVITINKIFKIYSFIPEELTPKEQRKSNWKLGGVGGLDFSQAYFKDWVKGGENKTSLLSTIKLNANYAKDKLDWKNEVEFKLGTLKPGDNNFQKNEDLIKFSTTLGLKASKNWLLSINSNTSTQFLKGYKYPNDSVPVSKFLSPLKHIGGLGSDYSPNKNFSLFMSPLSLKSTYVRDTTVGQEKYGIPKGKKTTNEVGFQLKTEWKTEIWKDIKLQTKLSLFSSYLDNPEKIDVDWETNLILQFNKYIKTTVFTHLLYDYNVKIPVLDENNQKIGETDAVQFKQTLSIGFAYNF